MRKMTGSISNSPWRTPFLFFFIPIFQVLTAGFAIECATLYIT